MEALMCKTLKNPEANSCERDRSLRLEKLKRNIITITESQKKANQEKTVSKSRYP